MGGTIGGSLGNSLGGTKASFQSAPTTPAPNPADTAAAQYQARLQFDPQVAAMEMGLQKQYVPEQTALYSSLYNQYYPQMARQQQALQQELFPQQSRILESGATQALSQLQAPESALLQALGTQAQAGLTPTGYTPEQQAAVEAIRGRELQRTQQGLRERSNLGGTLYGGRGQELESRATQQLGQQFAAEDIDRLMAQRQTALATASGVAGQQMQARQMAQQVLNPYMSILYPQIGQQQPQVSPYQFQSAVPSADTLYNAYFQASQPEQVFQQAQPSPVWGMLGQAAGTKAAMKCIPEGTIIDTPDKPKKVEDIRAGDIVLDKDGIPSKVLMKYEFDELPSDDRFLELDFNGVKIVICDLHKINGIRAMDLDVPKKFVRMDKRSYDLLTSGKDGSYMSNGIGIDTMIPELHQLTKMLQEV